jgi:hypothetical protein
MSNAVAQNWMTATEHKLISPVLNRNELISVPFSFMGCTCTHQSSQSVELPRGSRGTPRLGNPGWACEHARKPRHKTRRDMCEAQRCVPLSAPVRWLSLARRAGTVNTMRLRPSVMLPFMTQHSK